MGTLLLVPLCGIAVKVARAEEPTRWIHVRVVSTEPDGEMVRVNVPVELAEQVLPAIHTHELREGKVTIHEHDFKGVDLKELYNAIRNAPDNEFVSVQSKDENVHIAKEKGTMIIKVRQTKNSGEDVDITVPLPVVEALLSAGEDQLDILAGLKALRNYGDTDLVTVKEKKQTVHIWLDSKNKSE
ncbi:MAG: hypothetical protein DMG21_22280 [Acidobacteria bacterium]|nr:MAG: hypothetical protein DMG21_22280 [Acidobacteriota bacterium]